MRVLVATINPAKVERLRLHVHDARVEFLTPTELGLAVIDVEEGSDIFENARRKAAAYRGLTDLPVLGMDSAFVIPGEDLDPAMVRRNALAGRDEATMSRDEIADAMIGFYRALALRRGGSVPAHWADAYALSLPDGTMREERSERPVTLTAEVHGKINPHLPMRSLYVVAATGKYSNEQTPEDEALEFLPYAEAVKRLLGIA